MGGISATSIARSLSAMAFDLQLQREHKAKDVHRNRLAETDQQFQLEVSGVGGGIAGWTHFDIAFDEIIYNAPAQRDNPLSEPHMVFGYVMESGPPVMLSACVTKWKKNASGHFIGAKVAVSAMGGSGAGRVKARVHLTFQGLSAPNDPDMGS